MATLLQPKGLHASSRWSSEFTSATPGRPAPFFVPKGRVASPFRAMFCPVTATRAITLPASPSSFDHLHRPSSRYRPGGGPEECLERPTSDASFSSFDALAKTVIVGL